MLLPVSQVASLVNSLKLDWIDKVYLNEVPNEDVDNSDLTVMLLQETDSTPSDYANSTFKGVFLGVEVQVFYSLDMADDFNLLQAEIDLMKSFKDAGWSIVSSQHHTTDPDTNQITKTIYVTKDCLI